MKNYEEEFDRRLVGKWYKEDMGETVNIFDETPLRMKMSFSSTGYYNFEPNCVYEKDGYLCYEINDEYYRMVYHVRYADGILDGFYVQHGRSTPVKYIKISNTPEDEPFFKNEAVVVPNSDKPRIEILKEYAEYDRDKEYGCGNEFILGGAIPEILKKYGYSEYISGLDRNDDAIVFALLDFVCDNFGHNGSNGFGGSHITDLIEFCRSHESKTNCRGLSILLASLIRLYGIKARHITCMPYEEPFMDCHVVVDCLLPSGTRIMLDPTYRLYLKDREGGFVSLPHLRELLLSDEPIFENPTAGYNGGGFDKEYYRDYMIKNTLRFERSTLHKDGVDGRTETSRVVELIPRGYPITNFSEGRRENFVYNDAEFWRM
ncbi:MAG: transglutaminase-like domain-containing protein [Lachnospiraceae bacterium]|nr:transglutaminase-like domain-containing protein [Lachnospiraceae bacterium]